MRDIWKGNLLFGLVDVPIGLVSASSSNDLDFHLIDDRDNNRVGYRKVNKETGEEVPEEHIKRAYEVEEGKYVVVEEEDFEAADPEGTQQIEIDRFVDPEAVEPYLFDRPYYLEVGEDGEREYVLLRHVLKESGKFGIGKFVLRNRDRLGAIYVEDDVIVVQTIRFDNEVRSPERVEVPSDDLDLYDIDDDEVEKAIELIEEMSEDWDPTDFEDSYREELIDVIESKAEGEEIEIPEAEEEVSEAEGEELVEKLEESLEEEG